jgi:hypothetical protein
MASRHDAVLLTVAEMARRMCWRTRVARGLSLMEAAGVAQSPCSAVPATPDVFTCPKCRVQSFIGIPGSERGHGGTELAVERAMDFRRTQEKAPLQRAGSLHPADFGQYLLQ